MMKPITVPSRPRNTRLLPMCLIDPIPDRSLILSAEALIARDWASWPWMLSRYFCTCDEPPKGRALS